MNIVIDIGNSRVKLGYFKETRLLAVEAFLHADFPNAALNSEAWQTYSGQSKYLGLASVGNNEMLEAAEALLKSAPHLKMYRIDQSTVLPIGNRYASKATLGMDRVCAAVAAFARERKGPLLVINAGTAMTFDYVDENGNYLGGSIAPGLRTRFRALETFTAKLPLVSKDGPAPLIGDSTETSIRSGVVNGMLAEIEGMIANYRALAGASLVVYLTGGDAEFLGNQLKSVTFVDANLLLYGINTLVLHHA